MAGGKKTNPRQRTMGTCGHYITPVKRNGNMMWYCYETPEHGYDTKPAKIVLQPRGKAK